MEYFLNYQLYFLQEQLGKRVQLNHIPVYVNMLNRYRVGIPDSLVNTLDNYIYSGLQMD